MKMRGTRSHTDCNQEKSHHRSSAHRALQAFPQPDTVDLEDSAVHPLEVDLRMPGGVDV